MPGTRCKVGVCLNTYTKTKTNPETAHIRYHKFPEDEELRNTWIQLCKRGGQWNSKVCHVCSVHFKEDDYERDLRSELLGLPQKKVLKKNAAPSLHLTAHLNHRKQNAASENLVPVAAKRGRKPLLKCLSSNNNHRNAEMSSSSFETIGSPPSGTVIYCRNDDDCLIKHAGMEQKLNFKLNFKALQEKCALLQRKLHTAEKKINVLSIELQNFKRSRSKHQKTKH